MWSLGVTLYEMLVGGPPFRGMTREEIVANALSLNYDTRPEALSVEARQLVDAMLQVLPSDRASVAEPRKKQSPRDWTGFFLEDPGQEIPLRLSSQRQHKVPFRIPQKS